MFLLAVNTSSVSVILKLMDQKLWRAGNYLKNLYAVTGVLWGQIETIFIMKYLCKLENIPSHTDLNTTFHAQIEHGYDDLLGLTHVRSWKKTLIIFSRLFTKK